MTPLLERIATSDGDCTTEVVVPDGGGPWPAVMVFFDAGGLRPAMTRIAQRIAAGGYLVFQPDLFHRAPPLSTLIPGPITLAAMRAVFQDPGLRTRFMAGYYAPALAYANLERTVGAVLQRIEAHPQFLGRVGTTGYCMGGNVSVRVATLFGPRIAATAAFHPGGLVSDQADSPHLRVQAIASRLYLAPATGDLLPEAEAKLRANLDAARVRYEIAHYDADHGYAIDDGPSYDAGCAERHHAALADLFGSTLHGRSASAEPDRGRPSGAQ